MRAIGIDPGVNGGIAWIDDEGNHAVKMPKTDKDIWLLLAVLEDTDAFAYLEYVRSSPQMCVASAFTFGRGYGGLRMALIAAGIPFEEITPKKWQRIMGCRSKGDKNVTKAKAQELFPDVKITHAIADALLLAECCLRRKSNENT